MRYVLRHLQFDEKNEKLSPCFWLAELSWGYLVFRNIIDLCCTTFMLSL